MAQLWRSSKTLQLMGNAVSCGLQRPRGALSWCHAPPVNLGNPYAFGMPDVARRVRELAGSRAPIVFLRMP